MATGAVNSGSGLSPRVRGNPHDLKNALLSRRSIPACAGEPYAGALPGISAGVYPRVCGGTVDGKCRPASITGLSPRVRGNPLPAAGRRGLPGSIPACAGEPIRSWRSKRASPVYPRVCGGTLPGGRRLPPRQGLSPRVRGNRGVVALGVGAGGSIPACAGEPCAGGNIPSPGQVYPRVCGGTVGDDPGRAPLRGLSPRVRGNPVQNEIQLAGLRSIPACAGEPQHTSSGGGPDRVYPRVCGGTLANFAHFGNGEGLSPRVRGNPRLHRGIIPPGRSIPACAGEPRIPSGTASSRRVYPRVCGGTPVVCPRCTAITGLSPRVRGNLNVLRAKQGLARSIPACAGEPVKESQEHTRLRVYPRVCGGTALRE